jgi:hypothetical protein
VRILDVVRGVGQRYNDIGAQLNAEYDKVQQAKAGIDAQAGAIGSDNAPYDVCAKVLDHVKSVILHLVKMLEVCVSVCVVSRYVVCLCHCRFFFIVSVDVVIYLIQFDPFLFLLFSL